jgi:hypothetical protein
MATAAPVATGFREAPQEPRLLIQHQLNDSRQRRKAIAFLLGWDSKIILGKNPLDKHRQLLLAITQYLRALNVTLKHPLSYYFETPMRGNGRRAQMFADETYTQLGGADSEIANHFGAASNLLLNLAHTETASEKRKAELRTIVSVLDIPAYLRDVPTRDTQDWAASIKYYFASSLTRERPPR